MQCSATFGLTVTQSSPSGRAMLPFVSIANLNPCAWNPSIKSLSTCNPGSPPVNTIHRQLPASSFTHAINPSSVTGRPLANSVSQSNPPGDLSPGSISHRRLQAVNRKKTFAVPHRKPSPWTVRKTSLTVYQRIRRISGLVVE